MALFFGKKYDIFGVFSKKCKKMKKNEKKSQKNLHISKICCNFALSFQMREREPKRKPIKTEKK